MLTMKQFNGELKLLSDTNDLRIKTIMKNLTIILNTFWILPMILFFMNCQVQKGQTNNMKSMQLTYADGSGNTWKITKNSLSYKPVKPEMSSSGIYDGGEEAHKSLSDSDFQMLKAEFEKIFNHKEIQIQNRIMTSGMLSISDKNGNVNKIIIRSGKEMYDLEKILKDLIKN
jgi:hypothetical protein